MGRFRRVEEEMPRTCTVCGKPEDDHPFRHAFTTTGGITTQKEQDDSGPLPPPGSVPPSGDPVLRLALIRRGLIDLADIEAVEAELKGAGIAIGNSMGKPRER